jgi:hypothetical protein
MAHAAVVVGNPTVEELRRQLAAAQQEEEAAGKLLQQKEEVHERMERQLAAATEQQTYRRRAVDSAALMQQEAVWLAECGFQVQKVGVRRRWLWLRNLGGITQETAGGVHTCHPHVGVHHDRQCRCLCDQAMLIEDMRAQMLETLLLCSHAFLCALGVCRSSPLLSTAPATPGSLIAASASRRWVHAAVAGVTPVYTAAGLCVDT